MILEILTGVLVLITGFYAWATYRMLKANEKVIDVMREETEAKTRPYIVVSPILKQDSDLFYLVIKNTGTTSAHDLKLSLDKPFYTLGNKDEKNNMANFSAFNETIKSFHPSQEIIFILAQSFEIIGENAKPELMPDNFVVTAEYNFFGKTVTENNIIDLKPYKMSTMPQDKYIQGLKDIAKALNK